MKDYILQIELAQSALGHTFAQRSPWQDNEMLHFVYPELVEGFILSDLFTLIHSDDTVAFYRNRNESWFH